MPSANNWWVARKTMEFQTIGGFRVYSTVWTRVKTREYFRSFARKATTPLMLIITAYTRLRQLLNKYPPASV